MAKDKFLKIRTTAEEKTAFIEMAARRGTDVSSIIRSHLERLMRRDAGKNDRVAK